MKMSRPGRFTRDSGLGNGPRGLPPKTPVKTIPTGGPVQGQRLSTTPIEPQITGITPEQTARVNAMKASLSSAQPQQLPPTLAGALKSGTLQNAPKTMASMPQTVGGAQAKAMGLGFKKGGKVKSTSSYKSGGSVSSASKRADGCATKGKTKGKIY